MQNPSMQGPQGSPGVQGGVEPQGSVVVVEPQGTPVPSQVQVVSRQSLRPFRLHAPKALPVSPAHVAEISSEQTLPLHGRVAVATETMVLIPRITAAKTPTACPPIIEPSPARVDPHRAFRLKVRSQPCNGTGRSPSMVGNWDSNVKSIAFGLH